MSETPRALNLASKGAVHSALLTLVDSVNKANGMDVSIDPSEQIAKPSIDQIEATVSVLEEALESLRLEVRTRVATIQQRRNAMVPFCSRLPTELLANILLLACSVPDDDISKSIHHDRLHMFAQVSTLWKDVVCHTPRLWAYIDSSPWPKMELCLRKSKDSPLTLRLGWREEAALPFLASSAWRWQSLHIEHMDIQGPVGCVETPTPLLRYLTLDNGADIETHTPVWKMSGGPQLQTLTLSRVVLDWSVGTFSGLTELSIYHIHEESLGFNTFLDMLAGCNKLSSISITELIPPSLSMLLGPSLILLPHLTDLNIAAVGRNTARALFDRLEAPALRQLMFKQRFQSLEDAERAVFAPILSTANGRRLIQTAFANTHSEKQPVSVFVSHGSPSNPLSSSNPPGSPICLVAEGYNSRAPLRREEDLVPLNDLGLPIRLHLGSPSFECSDLIFLWELDMLSVLRARQMPRSKIIDLLLFPLPHEEANDIWPCPNLQVLDIAGEPSTEDITRLEERNQSVQRRRERFGGPSGPGWKPFRPLRFEV
ncbi:hypothetical protein FRB99_009038 [Tulasnella sp. 403]|nr:hypothetical protein FRB99_009038 [Tulasnella sp. 403]